MSDTYPYLSIDEEPPSRKLGHYKLLTPVILEPLDAPEQAFVDRLVKAIENEVLHGSGK